MGKFKKGSKFGHSVAKPGALEDQLLNEKYAKPTSRVNKRDRKSEESGKKAVSLAGVLSQVRELQEETASEELKKKIDGEEQEEEEEFEMPDHPDTLATTFQDDMNIKLSNEEQQIYASFMTTREKSCIAQMRDTLFEQHDEIKTQCDEESNAGGPVFSDEILEMFDDAAVVLREYRSGQIPKMLKVLPRLRNWIHLLYRLKPENWSAAAMFMLTKVFSHQSAEMAQVFYCKVLLPRLRDDIAQYKKLNAHLYRALGISLFKSAAFFKGLIFPLCMNNDCSLREAVIFGSLLAKKRIPLSAAAAAMRIIAGLEYTGANSIFLRVLINKKYSLPWTVIDDLCAHFVRCKLEDRKLPLLWHQCLLTFVQRYREDLSREQKQQLTALTAFHPHKDVSPEVRRELENSSSRAEK